MAMLLAVSLDQLALALAEEVGNFNAEQQRRFSGLIEGFKQTLAQTGDALDGEQLAIGGVELQHAGIRRNAL